MTHPFAESGVWPAVTSHLDIDHHVEDPDSWTTEPPRTAAWFETAAEWSPAIVIEEPIQASPTQPPKAPMNGRHLGEAIGAVLAMIAFTAIVLAGLKLTGSI